MTALIKLWRTSAFRWLIGYAVIFALVVLGVVGYIFWLTNNLVAGQLLQTIGAEVQGLREQYNAGGLALLRQSIDERARSPGNSLYLLLDQRGTRLAGNLSDVPAELGVGPGGGRFAFLRNTSNGSERREAIGFAIAVRDNVRLIVGRDIEDQRLFAKRVRAALIWGLGLVTLVGIGGALLASRRILARIDDVTQTSRTIMGGDLTGRLAIDGTGDEFDRLAENLNQMLARIEQLMTGMKEVSDNIAHDLKTPLTRLRNSAEAALREGGDAKRYKTALEATIERADDLIRTFNALLSIARLEANAIGRNFKPVALDALAQDFVELYEPLAEEAGAELRLADTSAITIDGDRELLGQAVANLIENALKYGCSDCQKGIGEKSNRMAEGNGKHQVQRVAVWVRAGDGCAEIIVADNGPGIPAEDRERVLRRFVRLQESRSAPGTGLGLSLVAAVARLHDGSIALEDNEPGLRAILRLPCHHRHEEPDAKRTH